MIDIHTHILPHLDDGARESRISEDMLKTELSQGVKTVVFSPHFYGRRHSPAQFIERRNAAYEKLKARIPAGIDVRLGAEVHFTGVNVMEEEVFCSLAIQGTKYVLVELPFDSAWQGELLNRLSVLATDAGCTPIIAHVERYEEVLKNPGLVSTLVHNGCLIQVNSYAFLDKREKNFAFALLKHGLIHCVGSDAHEMDGRKPNLAEAKAAVEKAGYAQEWQTIQETMQKILADERVKIPAFTPVKKFLWWYL